MNAHPTAVTVTAGQPVLVEGGSGMSLLLCAGAARPDSAHAPYETVEAEWRTERAAHGEIRLDCAWRAGDRRHDHLVSVRFDLDNVDHRTPLAALAQHAAAVGVGMTALFYPNEDARLQAGIALARVDVDGLMRNCFGIAALDCGKLMVLDELR